jgi:hypothetical protein
MSPAEALSRGLGTQHAATRKATRTSKGVHQYGFVNALRRVVQPGRPGASAVPALHSLAARNPC